MMGGVHPWTGLADEVRLGLLTKWVTAEQVDQVLAECGLQPHLRPGENTAAAPPPAAQPASALPAACLS
jgi:hypothetical protein